MSKKTKEAEEQIETVPEVAPVEREVNTLHSVAEAYPGTNLAFLKSSDSDCFHAKEAVHHLNALGFRAATIPLEVSGVEVFVLQVRR